MTASRVPDPRRHRLLRRTKMTLAPRIRISTDPHRALPHADVVGRRNDDTGTISPDGRRRRARPIAGVRGMGRGRYTSALRGAATRRSAVEPRERAKKAKKSR